METELAKAIYIFRKSKISPHKILKTQTCSPLPFGLAYCKITSNQNPGSYINTTLPKAKIMAADSLNLDQQPHHADHDWLVPWLKICSCLPAKCNTDMKSGM